MSPRYMHLEQAERYVEQAGSAVEQTDQWVGVEWR